MAKRVSLSGNEAVAIAMKQINPDVVAAFPITPSTEVPQYFSQYVANGQVTTEFVPVESEHSAMSACIGAAAAGGRVMTATSSAGLALMFEMLGVASAKRLPITLALVNRTLSGPLNIHNDHTDAMAMRDTGWIQIFGENCQEAYDNFVQAIRIGEHPEVQLPVAVNFDGFITSHAVENLEVLEDAEVKAFVGEERVPAYSLLAEESIAMGPLVLPVHFMEQKRQQFEAMKNAKKVVLEVAAEYEKLTGRKYSFFEEYMMEDAEAAIVILNSSAGTAKTVIDKMRAEGKKVGLIKIRMFRPFPAEELAAALANVKGVAVMDKAEGFSTQGGPVFTDVRSAMYGKADGKVVMSYIYGLGGRDVTTYQIDEVYAALLEAINTGKYEAYNYVGVRE
jgi:pyruvate ferredoxin oxidoreductase alpha subunit